MAPTKPVKADLIERITGIVHRAGSAAGIEPVAVSFAGSGSRRMLRIVIDKPGGVTLGDCESVSRYVDRALDTEDIVPGGGYTLEVSSPGERRLTTHADFERFAGKSIRIVLREPIAKKTVWTGVLNGISAGQTITLVVPEGPPMQFHLDQVARANLRFEQ
jgi:ribosome maturation factor RimP